MSEAVLFAPTQHRVDVEFRRGAFEKSGGGSAEVIVPNSVDGSEQSDRRGLTNDDSGFLEPNRDGPGTYAFHTYGRPEAVRLLPLSALLRRYPRAIRDLARTIADNEIRPVADIIEECAQGCLDRLADVAAAYPSP